MQATGFAPVLATVRWRELRLITGPEHLRRVDRRTEARDAAVSQEPGAAVADVVRPAEADQIYRWRQHSPEVTASPQVLIAPRRGGFGNNLE